MATKKPYRCYNPPCADNPAGGNGHDFYGDEATCPKCGLTKKQNPAMLVALEEIHYDTPASSDTNRNPFWINKPSTGRTACDGSLIVSTSGRKLSTGSPPAVTCWACRQTEVWRHDAEAWGVEVPALEVEIEVTKDGITQEVT